MHLYREKVIVEIFSDGISTRIDDLNNLTNQSASINDTH